MKLHRYTKRLTLSGRQTKINKRSAEAKLARKTLTGLLLTCVCLKTATKMRLLPKMPTINVTPNTNKLGPNSDQLKVAKDSSRSYSYMYSSSVSFTNPSIESIFMLGF